MTPLCHCLIVNQINNNPCCTCVQASGLLSWMSSKLDWLQELPQWSMLLLISFILSMLTEFISNSAASSLFMPLFGHMVSFTLKQLFWFSS